MGAILILPYLILLIPPARNVPDETGKENPFEWNRDRHWAYLENAFKAAKKVSCQGLNPEILRQSKALLSIVEDLENGPLPPESPVFKRIEERLFTIAPSIAACPKYFPFYHRVLNTLRTSVKKQSEAWDMDSALAKETTYRLLYGSRASIEEIILQSEDDDIPNLIKAVNEPSRCPSTEVLMAQVHSGDILVSRGGAATSALIARGSDYPGNFSHVALVHVDEATNKPSIIEAHIERGVAVSSLHEYLEDKKLRVMILRMKADHPSLTDNPLLPHVAATAALEEARSRHIPYDFSMDYKEHSALFCSEVASAAYAKYGVRLWAGISHISAQGLRQWLSDFGVKHFITQEPSDLEYDPQLQVVAEWRNLEALYQDHMDNAIIDVMLEEANEGKTLSYNYLMLPIARLMKGYSLLLNLSGKVGPIPEGMSAAAALKNAAFTDRHARIKEELQKKARIFLEESGYRPPYWELVRMAKDVIAA